MNHLKIYLSLLAIMLNVAMATVSTSDTAPTTNILSSDNSGAINTTLFPLAGSAPSPIAGHVNHARGQIFNLPNGSGTAYQITAITIKKSNTATFDNDSLTLRIFEGTSAQWDTGTGHASGSNFYSGTTVTPLHSEVFILDGAINNNDYVTLQLTTPITVDENADFGFFLTYDPSSGTSPVSFQHREGSDSGRLSITTSSHETTATRRMNYFVQGTPITAGPDLELASPFQDRMVLQRGKNVKVWGTTDPNANVSVTIAGISASSTADAQGKWQLELPPLPVGNGSQTLIATSGTTTKTINDILIGDVWFCFGQSNMVYNLNSMAAWKTTYINAIQANDNIRCLKITQNGSLTESETNNMNWLDNSTAGTWSAVGSTFAKNLHDSTGVPVAIIWAAWGSSSIEGWMPQELTEKIPHFADMMTLYQSIGEYDSGATTSSRLPTGYTTNETAIAGLSANGWSTTPDDIFMRTRPNIIYNKMIHPMRHYGISGFIWYQGEANAGTNLNAARYKFSLPAMLTEYRERFDQGDIPILGVQLPYYKLATWPLFRETQYELETLNNAHLCVTRDTGFYNNIHPTDKEPIGVRLALMAREYALGESIESFGPRFDSIAISGNQVTIDYTHATGLTTTDSTSPKAFEIAGSNEVYHPATSTSISGGKVIISSTSVTNPVAVRYAWTVPTTNDVNLVNSDGLPAAPFRTDSWDITGLSAQTPHANNDNYEINRDGTLTVPADGILTNDIDLNWDPLTATLITDVTHGDLTLLPDGSFTYTPNTGYAGTDSFTYRASDGASTSQTTTVNITILGTSSAYYIWKTNIIWNSKNDSRDADPDHDGLTNFLEFALDTNPLLSEKTGHPTLTKVGNDYHYDFNPARPGHTYEVLISNDMDTWIQPSFATLTSTSTTPVTIPTSNEVDGKMFVRLKVTEDTTE